MDYWLEYTTPANTAKKDAVETEYKLVAGTITEVWVWHPEGCAGLAHATLVKGIHQLYPTNPEGSYHGEGHPIHFYDNYKLRRPAKLKLVTWNLDDTYAHAVYVRVTVMHREEDLAVSKMTQLINLIKSFVGA